MLRLTRLIVTGAALVAAAGLPGCGDGSSGTAAARVADATISDSALDHWVAVMKTEQAIPPKQVPRQHALSFLISSQWLIDEAASRGVGVSEQEVQQRFEQKVKELLGGQAEFDKFLKLTGKTAADVKLEAKADLAAAKLLALLVSKESKITQAQVVEYYRRNPQEFTTDEQRAVKIIHTRSEASARRIADQLRSGRLSVSKIPMESLEYGKRTGPSRQEPLYRAIYAARRNVVVGPVVVDGSYFFVFEVTTFRRPIVEPLAVERSGIEARLVEAQRRRTIAEFVDAWRRKWVPQTDCDAGVVVQQCRQYSGPVATEDPFASS